MSTNTVYGSWLNFEKHELTVGASIGTAVGDFGDDYDLDAIESDYRDAINEALPQGVSLSGDEFLGPYFEADQNFDGYPLTDDGGLDITTIIESVDLWPIVEKREQWTIAQVAEELGYKTESANAGARKKLSDWGVKAVAHRPNAESGRVQAYYSAQKVREAKASRPGKGVGGGRKPQA